MSDKHIVGRATTMGEEWELADKLNTHMLIKLKKNRGKAHWRNPADHVTYLLARLTEEVEELDDAVMNEESSESIGAEAADVGNFAAMIADLYEKGPFNE